MSSLFHIKYRVVKWFLLGLAVSAFNGCKSININDARLEYVKGNYSLAAESYRQIYRKIKPQDRILRGIVSYEMAEANRKANYTSRAVNAYANAIRYNYPDTMMYLHYAQMLHKEGKYSQAKDAYGVCLDYNPTCELALNGIKGVELSQEWIANPSRFKVKIMDVFNSGKSQFSPYLTQKDEIYITSSRTEALGDTLSSITGLKKNDVFISKKNDKNQWEKPQRIKGGINTNNDEGVISISFDGNYMFYTSSTPNLFYPTSTKIFFSQWGSAEWLPGKEFIFPEVDSLSVLAHPSIDGKSDYLYFVSNIPGGYGGNDIWRAKLIDYKVINIENLGPEINTNGDEMFPFIMNDSTLYFSSNGHPGMGGLDIFVAQLNKSTAKWEVSNMGYPINSSADDFGITFEDNLKRGFFSSNRNDLRGYDKIYSFDYEEYKFGFTFTVSDLYEKPIAHATITLIESNGEQQIISLLKDGTQRTNAKNDTRYLIQASAEGFLNKKIYFSTPSELSDTIFDIHINLTPLDEPVVIENIFYDFNSAAIRPESKEALDALLSFMLENPHIIIELSAHTDRIGNEKYNQQLSQQRAQSVVDFLIKGNIDKKRLIARGYGKNVPAKVSEQFFQQYDFLLKDAILDESYIESLSPEYQSIADHINRRTEFKIIDTNFGLR